MRAGRFAWTIHQGYGKPGLFRLRETRGRFPSPQGIYSVAGGNAPGKCPHEVRP